MKTTCNHIRELSSSRLSIVCMSTDTHYRNYKWFIITILVALAGILLSYRKFERNPLVSSSQVNIEKTKMSSKVHNGSILSSSHTTTPVYFFSHGGPTFMYPNDDFGGNPEAYLMVSKIGKFIKDVIKPKFIIVVSAHWQSSGSNLIEIAVPKTVKGASKSLSDAFLPGSGTGDIPTLDPMENELIYDFYGFPDHMYKETFHSKCDVELASDIVNEINNSNGSLKAVLSNRGIDHGAWVPFKVAFSTNKSPGSEWDLDIPVVQVSMTSTDDFDTHYELGSILSKYRKKGGQIIVSGMSVHNLKDIGRSISTGEAMPYVKPFNDMIANILKKPESEGSKLAEFKKMRSDPNSRNLLYSAHPTLDHFVPLIVGLGAGEGTEGDGQFAAKEMYTGEKLSLGWGLYQFGN